jgi:hypothetical protein
MNIKHKLGEVDNDNPFLKCKLGREKYAHILTDIITNYEDGFVLAINNEWGTGKTTFVKMWQQLLTNKGFQTLYFNAWESDFEDNPMIALMAEFKSLTGKKSNKNLKSLLEKGSKVIKNLAPQGVKILAEVNGITKIIAELAENATKGATEILEDEIKKYNNKKAGIKDFTKTLEKFVESIEGKKPIIFIIDELDRCRPNYAVLLLEQIKHLFTVPGIVFVLAIDKEQLGHAMRGVYGSEKLNADEYLRRFIDLEYNIPQPNTKDFVLYLYDYFKFDEKLFQEGRQSYNDFRDENVAILNFAVLLFEEKNITLRQQEKIFAHGRIALSSLKWNQYLLPGLFIFLVYLKHLHQNTYYLIRKRTISTQEMLDVVSKVLPKNIGKFDISNIIFLEALLATTYHNYKFEKDRTIRLLFEDPKVQTTSVNIRSNFDNEDQVEFTRMIKSMQSREYGEISIKYMTDKIDLLQEITT